MPAESLLAATAQSCASRGRLTLLAAGLKVAQVGLQVQLGLHKVLHDHLQARGTSLEHSSNEVMEASWPLP